MRTEVEKCPKCENDMVCVTAYMGSGGDVCPKCHPDVYTDHSWGQTVVGPATHEVSTGKYYLNPEILWGTNSIQQFSDDELHIVAEYRKSGKLPGNKEIKDN